MPQRTIGLVLMGAAAALALLGLVVYWGGLSWFGRLPGDIRYETESTRFYFPLTSMIVVSLALTLIVNLARRLL